MLLLFQVVGDENSVISQYCPPAPPSPKLQILRRPNGGSSSSLSSMGGESSSSSKTSKTLKQREEEYAQARLRILGSAGEEEPNGGEDVVEDIPHLGGASAVVVERKESSGSAIGSVAALEALPKPLNVALRPPKGPDGTRGFCNKQQQPPSREK